MKLPTPEERLKAMMEALGNRARFINAVIPSPLPACMVPDGGEGACSAFLTVQEDNVRLAKALEDIQTLWRQERAKVKELEAQRDEMEAVIRGREEI